MKSPQDSTERDNGIKSFELDGVVFHCRTVTSGPDAGTFVWRSACGRLSVGRVGGNCWACVDGQQVHGTSISIKDAMQIAIRTRAVREARAA